MLCLVNRKQDLERPNLAIILSFYSQLGDEWELKPEVQEQLEAFTCVMYSHARETSVNLVRSKMLRKMVGEDEALSSRSRVDFARMPPCQDALIIPHIQQVNYRVASYKRAAEPIFWRPKPYDKGQGWQKTELWSPSGLVGQFCHNLSLTYWLQVPIVMMMMMMVMVMRGKRMRWNLMMTWMTLLGEIEIIFCKRGGKNNTP